MRYKPLEFPLLMVAVATIALVLAALWLRRAFDTTVIDTSDKIPARLKTGPGSDAYIKYWSEKLGVRPEDQAGIAGVVRATCSASILVRKKWIPASLHVG